MSRGLKTKPDIICPRCGRKATPVRGYCRSCASFLVRRGDLPKIFGDATAPKELTKYQEEILNGLMLGDGCIYRHTKTCKPHLTIIRSQNDRNYLIENYNVFKDFCKSGVVDGSILDKRTGNTNFYSKFVTRRCGAFIPYYEKWYPNREKSIPKDLVLTPLTLAIWFSDDGYIGNSCSKWRFKLQLSTDDFATEDVERIRLELEKICNEHFFVSGNQNNKSLRIGAADSGTRSFIRVIDKYLPESMLRKAIWRNLECRFYENQPMCKSKMDNSSGRIIEKERFEKLILEKQNAYQIMKIFSLSKSGLMKKLKQYEIEIFKGFYNTGAKIGRPKRLP